MFRDCSIVFNDRPNGIFFSGEHVSGFFRLVLSEPKRVTDLEFKSKGVSKCQWSRKRGKHSVTYSATIVHYRSTMSLLMHHTRDPDHHDTVLLEAGTHSFPFSVTLPEELPTTFEGQIGHVRYTIKVKADKRLRLDETFKLAFTVMSKCDLNHIPNCNLPTQKIERHIFYACCFSRGAVQMTVSLPVKGFIPGQNIPITCSVNNYSLVPIREIMYSFRRIVTYTATEPNKSVEERKKNLTEYTGKGVAARSKHVYQIDFPVPTVPPTTTMTNQPVDIQYVLRIADDEFPLDDTVELSEMAMHLYLSYTVTGIVPWCHCNLEVDIPLVIGQIPFHTPPPSSAPSAPVAEGPTNQHYLMPPRYEECPRGSMNGLNSIAFHTECGNNRLAPVYPAYSFPVAAPQHVDNVIQKKM